MRGSAESELNETVRQIESALRSAGGAWNHKRFGTVRARDVRATISKYSIGLVCDSCLAERERGRYCSEEHRRYYNHITARFFGAQRPYTRKVACDHVFARHLQIDHILPIANGGLEFDRENLQWLCAKCNCRKSGGVRYTNGG